MAQISRELERRLSAGGDDKEDADEADNEERVAD